MGYLELQRTLKQLLKSKTDGGIEDAFKPNTAGGEGAPTTPRRMLQKKAQEGAHSSEERSEESSEDTSEATSEATSGETSGETSEVTSEETSERNSPSEEDASTTDSAVLGGRDTVGGDAVVAEGQDTVGGGAIAAPDASPLGIGATTEAPLGISPPAPPPPPRGPPLVLVSSFGSARGLDLGGEVTILLLDLFQNMSYGHFFYRNSKKWVESSY